MISLSGEDAIFGMVHMPQTDNSPLCLVIAKTDFISIQVAFLTGEDNLSQVPQGSLTVQQFHILKA